jgi:hypothetical protein
MIFIKTSLKIRLKDRIFEPRRHGGTEKRDRKFEPQRHRDTETQRRRRKRNVEKILG